LCRLLSIGSVILTPRAAWFDPRSVSNILADNRPNDVIAAVDKLISEINSGSKKISSEELFAVYGFKADAFSLLGNSQGAIATLKEAISLGNAPADTYLNLADAYMSERQFSEVVTACDAALKLSENNGEAFYMKAAALLQMVSNDNAVEELQNVVSLAEKAIARDKYLTDAHLVKARI
jgi:tetratricopeptide (TPR) repeat protein